MTYNIFLFVLVDIVFKIYLVFTSIFRHLKLSNIINYLLKFTLSSLLHSLFFMIAHFSVDISKLSKFGYRSRGRSKGSLFISYYIELFGEGAPPFLGLLYFTLDP